MQIQGCLSFAQASDDKSAEESSARLAATKKEITDCFNAKLTAVEERLNLLDVLDTRIREILELELHEARCKLLNLETADVELESKIGSVQNALNRVGIPSCRFITVVIYEVKPGVSITRNPCLPTERLAMPSHILKNTSQKT